MFLGFRADNLVLTGMIRRGLLILKQVALYVNYQKKERKKKKPMVSCRRYVIQQQQPRLPPRKRKKKNQTLGGAKFGCHPQQKTGNCPSTYLPLIVSLLPVFLVLHTEWQLPELVPPDSQGEAHQGPAGVAGADWV